MNQELNSVEILGVRVDNISMNQALSMVKSWLEEKDCKKYIVTPNPEFIMAAQKDLEFKKVLNNADLAIPDGSRLGWAAKMIEENNFFKKILLFPFFLFPIKQVIQFNTVAGVDLMEGLCKEAADQGFTTGFLGGQNGVAEKAADCLQKKYPKLKIVFASDGPKVDLNGEANWGPVVRQPHPTSSLVTTSLRVVDGAPRLAPPLIIPGCDILFVAFGQVKQEKWIAKNLDKIPVKIAMGVGGAFDYWSGNVKRAPVWMRKMGLEWLFRLILQPWRIKRQLVLINFISAVYFK